MSYDATVLAESGIVGYWPLSDPSGTTANDLAGSNPGTSHGGFTLAQGGADGALDAVLLNGSSGYVSVPDDPALNFNGSQTIECWARIASGGDVPLVQKYDGTFGNGYALLRSSPPSLDLVTSIGGVSGTLLADQSPLSDGVWHHLVVVYDATVPNVKLYVDGALVDTGTGPAAGDETNTKLLYFGHWLSADDPTGNATAQFLSGRIQRVALYGVALSGARVSAHYAAGFGPTQNLTPVGIHSSERWGRPLVSLVGQLLTPAGIPSSEAWGTPTVALVPDQVVRPAGIASDEAWGTPTVALTGPTTLTPSGIPSSEAWGIPLVLQSTPGVTPRNYLIDRITRVVYPWPVNHETEDSIKTLGRHLTTGGKSSVAGLIRRPTHPGPVHLVLHGKLIDRSQAQYQSFVTFFNNSDDRSFDYIDASGDSYHVVIVAFDAKRVASPDRDDGSYFEYSLEVEIVDVNVGALKGYAT